jgi:ribose transport system ATP-binding protein
MTTALDLRHVSKVFGATRALWKVDLTVEHHEVLALLGENGCGKSTLVKVLAGVCEPEPGARMSVGGREVALPMAAGTSGGLGLSFVHQDLGLAKPLTVVENLLVGSLAVPGQAPHRIEWRRQVRAAAEMLASYGVEIDPRSVVDELPPVDQALVAIARAADQLRRFRDTTGATTSVLVLDEPTVFLPEQEVEFLFDLVREVVASGSSVIFISHDLGAVRAIADRATILRDGRVVATTSMSEVTDDEVVELIVGPSAAAALNEVRSRPAPAPGGHEAPVRVAGLGGGRVRDLHFDVAPGEIVGLAGLMGSGVEDVPYLLFGARQATSGTLTYADTVVELARQQPMVAVSMGMALIPADRRRDAIAPAVSVAENMMMLVPRRFTRGGRLRLGELRRAADARAESLDIRPRRTNLPIGTLSGGNAQKVVLAKWLEIQPRLLLLHEPTQGVDVAARSEIYRVIERATETGMSVIWVSSDFEELATVCHRVVVVSDGVAAGQIDSAQLSPEAISTGVYAAARVSTASSLSTAGRASS